MKNRNLDHKDDWMTPPLEYKKHHDKYNFDFDPCPFKHDLSLWDGLKVDWGQRNWVNPPYSEKLKKAFVEKAIEESKKGKLCVMLLPVSTGTYLFKDTIEPNYKSIEFLKGRIPFIGQNSKGQYVNYHLVMEVTKETIPWCGEEIYPEDEDVFRIPKYIKANGQHDSMIVVFGPNYYSNTYF